MIKTIYIFSIVLLLIVIIYLAKELYSYYFREGLGMFGLFQNQQGITAAAAQSATMVQEAPAGYAATTPAAASVAAAPSPSTAAVSSENEYQVSTNKYKYDAFNKSYNDISNNVNVQFHDDYSKEKDDYGNPSGTSYITDKKGNVTAIPPTGLGVSPTYYKPKDYIIRYGDNDYGIIIPEIFDATYKILGIKDLSEEMLDTPHTGNILTMPEMGEMLGGRRRGRRSRKGRKSKRKQSRRKRRSQKRRR
jgi:hypothetical protein